MHNNRPANTKIFKKNLTDLDAKFTKRPIGTTPKYLCITFAFFFVNKNRL